MYLTVSVKITFLGVAFCDYQRHGKYLTCFSSEFLLYYLIFKDDVGTYKRAFDHKQLLRQLPVECKGFLEHIQSLKYGDRPNYEVGEKCALFGQFFP